MRRPVACLRSARGFTLIELMVAMTLSLVVLGGLMTLVVATTRATGRVTDRVDASQRGRVAMTLITQQLRPMVCLPVAGGAQRPVLEGTDTQVTWYANLDEDPAVDDDDRDGVADVAGVGDADGSFDPEKRRLTFDATAGTIVQSRWSGPLPVADTATPTTQRQLLAGVRQTGTTPFLRYYAYASSSATVPTLLPTPLSDADRQRVARVDVAYTADSAPARSERVSAPMEGTVFLRAVSRPAPPAPDLPIFSCSI